MSDPKLIAKEVAVHVREYMDSRLAPLTARVSALEGEVAHERAMRLQAQERLAHIEATVPPAPRSAARPVVRVAAPGRNIQ